MSGGNLSGGICPGGNSRFRLGVVEMTLYSMSICPMVTLCLIEGLTADTTSTTQGPGITAAQMPHSN